MLMEAIKRRCAEPRPRLEDLTVLNGPLRLPREIARGFGMSGTDHWGQTKAAIRDALLPRANKLLHLASVKLLLADALHRGQRILIVGSFAFWYENGNTDVVRI